VLWTKSVKCAIAHADELDMRLYGLDLIGAATGVVGCALGGLGLLSGADTSIVVGGCFATVAAGIAALRLIQWSRRVAEQPRPLQEWEFRPGFFIAVLVVATLIAFVLIDVGRSDLGAWSLPAAVAWFSSVVARGRLRPFLYRVIWPNSTR